MSNFDYYQVSFLLKTPQLGTASQTSIYKVHVIEKAKKEIAKANKLKGKMTKALDKYKGSEITPDKELRELQGVMRTYMQALGKSLDVPETVEEILESVKTLEDEWSEKLKKRDVMDATVFLRGKDGKPIIGTHMILGNLKANIKILVNNGDKSILTSKVSVGETFALDVKSIDQFMVPSNDIVRAKSKADFKALEEALPVMGTGKWVYEEETGRVLIERPILFNRMGKTETAIAVSEALPVGTEFSTILRVRKGSPINEEALNKLLDLGKSQGFGTWRGSGGAGAFNYQLEYLEDYKEEAPKGWL